MTVGFRSVPNTRSVSSIARVLVWLSLGASLGGCRDATVTSPADANHPPRIVAPPLTVFHDSEYRQTVEVVDPDGDSLTVQAVVLPTWMSFDPASRVLSGLPGVDRVGSHRVKIQADDGASRDTLSFFIQVRLRTSGLVFNGPWTVTGYRFGHDGQPYPSANFTVYSDFSAQEERRYLADAMEGHFHEMKAALGVTDDMLDGWTPQTRIAVLSLRAQADTVLWMGNSFRYGFIVHSPDSNRYVQAGYTRAIYDQLLRHELMHVVEYYLVGRAATEDSVEKWFREGIAMVMGGDPPGQIRSPGALYQWRQRMSSYPGSGNPVLVKTSGDYPTEIQHDAAALNGYYLAFELAVRYLLDPRGLGKTPEDVRNMYLAIRAGAPFGAAFEAQMGLSLASYEADFWTLMAQYLG